MLKLPAILRIWDRYWFTKVEVFPLGLFRVLFGLLLFILLVLLFHRWDFYFGLNGFFEFEQSFNLSDPHKFVMSFLSFGIVPWFIFWIGVLASILFTLGFQTRVSTIVLYIVFLFIFFRNPYVSSGLDQVINTFLFISCFAPLGATLSIDNVIKKRRLMLKGERVMESKHPVWTLRLMQISVALIYLFTALIKVVSDVAWRDGTAIYYISYFDLWFRGSSFEIFHNLLISKIMTYGTLIIEFGFPLFVWFQKTRYLVLLAGLSMHIGMALFMTSNITWFSLAMLCTYMLFIPSNDLEKILNKVFSMQYKVYSFVAILLATVICLLFTPLVHAQNQTIKMTSQGFQPAMVSLDISERVVFENTDTVGHWPASNIHPTHAIYPEFDPRKDIQPGESWSFTPSKPGIWRFHDHSNPNLNGQITVTGTSQQANQQSRNWPQMFWTGITLMPQRSSSFFDGILIKVIPGFAQAKLAKLDVVNLRQSDAQKLDFYLKNFGSKKILDKLLTDSNGGQSIDCHRQAHFIGREAFKLYGSEVFSLNDFSCHSGFIHGAMESFLQKSGTANLKADVSTLCDQLPTGFGRFECLHGVGHGVLAYQDYNLPEAIKECQKLSDSFSSTSCFGGMFMENVIAGQGKAAIIGHKTDWVSQDPHFPCNGINESVDLQIQCYMMQTSRMLDLFNYNFNLVVAECLKAPEQYQATCFQSFGRDGAGQALRDPNKIITYCSKVDTRYYNNCITGAVNVIIDFWGNQIADKPYALCKLVSAAGKQNCYQTVGGRLDGILGQDQQQKIKSCNFAESEYQQTCRQTAQVTI